LSILVPRVVQCTAVDRGIGADFHVVLDQYPADLGNLESAFVGPGKAESVGAEHGSAVHDNPVPEAYTAEHGHTRV